MFRYLPDGSVFRMLLPTRAQIPPSPRDVGRGEEGKGKGEGGQLFRSISGLDSRSPKTEMSRGYLVQRWFSPNFNGLGKRLVLNAMGLWLTRRVDHP